MVRFGRSFCAAAKELMASAESDAFPPLRGIHGDDKYHNADFRIMPTSVRKPAWEAVIAAKEAA